MRAAYKILLNLLLVSGFLANATAQKLPNKQETSVYGSNNINFQAYNHATDIFYTLSNDNENLYLTVKAANHTVIDKIINGGITFAINSSGKKDKGEISITYPVFEKNNKPGLDLNKTEIEQGLVSSVIQPDSIVKFNNTQLTNKSKYIMVIGVKGTDTLISVYNENNIKADAKFDNKMDFTCQFSVPLKYLGLEANSQAKFAYHIILNGESKLTSKGTIVSASSDNEIVNAKINAEMAEMGKIYAPTDFWGEYTLAKK